MANGMAHRNLSEYFRKLSLTTFHIFFLCVPAMLRCSRMPWAMCYISRFARFAHRMSFAAEHWSSVSSRESFRAHASNTNRNFTTSLTHSHKNKQLQKDSFSASRVKSHENLMPIVHCFFMLLASNFLPSANIFQYLICTSLVFRFRMRMKKKTTSEQFCKVICMARSSHTGSLNRKMFRQCQSARTNTFVWSLCTFIVVVFW